MTPRPLEKGDQAHLTWGSLRWSVARTMRLAASMTAEATGQVPPQYAALLAGIDVMLTRAQVASFVPSSRQPAKLDRYEHWLLVGTDKLRPVP